MSTEQPEPINQAAIDFKHYQELAHEHKWPPWAPTFLAALAGLPDITEASKQAGINRSTANSLRRRDDFFEDAVISARDVALDRLESTIYIRSTIGTPITKTITKTRNFRDGSQEVTTIEQDERHISDVLAIFYLKRWRPEFRDTYRVEQTGADGGPIDISVQEKMDEAVRRFDAEVVRLADVREARDASTNGSG